MICIIAKIIAFIFICAAIVLVWQFLSKHFGNEDHHYW